MVNDAREVRQFSDNSARRNQFKSFISVFGYLRRTKRSHVEFGNWVPTYGFEPVRVLFMAPAEMSHLNDVSFDNLFKGCSFGKARVNERPFVHLSFCLPSPSLGILLCEESPCKRTLTITDYPCLPFAISATNRCHFPAPIGQELDKTLSTLLKALLDKAFKSYSTALTISSTTFLASPNTIMVLSM